MDGYGATPKIYTASYVRIMLYEAIYMAYEYPA